MEKSNFSFVFEIAWKLSRKESRFSHWLESFLRLQEEIFSRVATRFTMELQENKNLRFANKKTEKWKQK